MNIVQVLLNWPISERQREEHCITVMNHLPLNICSQRHHAYKVTFSISIWGKGIAEGIVCLLLVYCEWSCMFMPIVICIVWGMASYKNMIITSITIADDSYKCNMNYRIVQK